MSGKNRRSRDMSGKNRGNKMQYIIYAGKCSDDAKDGDGQEYNNNNNMGNPL